MKKQMKKRKAKAVIEITCHYRECENTFKVPQGTRQYYCSRLCRHLARGGKKGLRKARKMMET